jgi:Fic family protein
MRAASSRHSRPETFRTQQNWIGGESIRSAVFVPPPVPRMEKALADLETYLQAPHEAPPLLRLAFIHYQFEAIHPFVDGNGRTGRLLIVLLLVHWGLLPLPLLYLSAFFEKRRRDYFELLLAVSERGVWREWCRFFLEGVAEQAKDAIARAKQLQDLQLDWHIRLTRMRVSATLLILADTLFDIPFITVPEAQKRLGTPSYNTAR